MGKIVVPTPTYQEIEQSCHDLDIPVEQICRALKIHRSKLKRWRVREPESITEWRRIVEYLEQLHVQKHGFAKAFPKDIAYISGPISYDADFAYANARMAFARAEAQLKSRGFATIINPMRLPHAEGATWDDCMILCLTSGFYEATKLYMMKGWEDSRGAAWEHKMALAMNKTIIYQQ